MDVAREQRSVGIPRALWYYYLFPFFKGILEELGARVVISPPTTKRLLADIDLCPTDEPCISIKLLFAHANALWTKGVDFVFLPIIVSLEKENFCCPKFIGSADMIIRGLGLPPERVLAPSIDFSRGEKSVLKSLGELGRALGGRGDLRSAARALAAGRRLHGEYRQLARGGLTTPEAYSKLHPLRGRVNSPLPDEGIAYDPNLRIGVVGHPYIIHEWIAHDLIDRLRLYGQVITAEMIPEDKVREQVSRLYEGTQLWHLEALQLGAALTMIHEGMVDKLVLVGCFECGPASIIEVFIEDEAAKRHLPLLNLRLDEHTGEAGLITRIEAFMDTSPAVGRGPVGLPGPRRGGETIGVPTVGYLDIPIGAMLDEWGVEGRFSPPVSRTIVAKGMELAPEFICFPFTAMIGQMKHLLDEGVGSILMVGGKGKCRLGWYAQAQEILLAGAGHGFTMLLLDSPFPLRSKASPFLDHLQRLLGGRSWPRIIKGFHLAYAKLAALDEGEKLLRFGRAFEGKRGSANRLWGQFMDQIRGAASIGSIKRALRELREAIYSLKEEADPLRVRLVGEIWVLMEPYANLGLEEFLGSRPDLRIWVDREVSPRHWVDLHLLRLPRARRREGELMEAAWPYLRESVGGHGLETVGQTILAPSEGMDGVIHLYPFTCMPEIVAQNILVQGTRALDIPLLTIIASEQTGEAGVETRIEAFLELLAERRSRQLALP
ncbi:MAG: acyl-CoA dehydratase activase-related protein [Limnochordia bacterium]|jgi:predicted nucleotide-binding protein (sugar kinase/HSP70/actin superfamily)|nr:hypothetical protein [Bacillota bacterium]